LLEYVSHSKSDHASWEDAFAELREEFGGAWPAHAEMLARDLSSEQDGRVRERGSIESGAAMLGALGEHDAVACARRIGAAQVPTLVIAAGRTRYHEPKRGAWQRFAAAGSPAVELHVDEQVGHHLLMESPDTYVPLITRWLRDVPIR
jgi:pimeloyl-ACP methyl ester carboxylesterase